MNIEKIFYIILSTALVTVFILFTFIFSTDGLNPGKSVKQKTIYFVDNISSAHQKVIDIFNERNKGLIKVETINLSFEKFSTNERKELLARYLRSKNNRIDIFSVDQIWVPRFAKWSVTLQNYFDSAEIKNIIPSALKTCYTDNQLLAVPLYLDVAVMFYRDDLLKKQKDYKQIIAELDSSITWEKFISLNNKAANSAEKRFIFQADAYEGLLCQFTELMDNQNNPIINGDKKILINTAEGKKALQLLVDLVDKYKISPAEVTHLKENESYKLFSNNDALFVRGWSSTYDDENDYLSADKQKNVKMAPTPYFTGTKPSSVYGGWNLMISKFSEKIPEVVKFAKFLLSEESQKIMYEEQKYLPIVSSVYTDTNFTNTYPELEFYRRLFGSGVHRPFLEEYTNVSDILSHYINLAIKKEISVNDALSEAEKKINEKIISAK